MFCAAPGRTTKIFAASCCFFENSHQTILLCSLLLMRNSVKQLGECMEARGVTEALLKEIYQQVGIIRVYQAKCGFVCNSYEIIQ